MQTIQLFVTCLVDSLFPDVGQATVDVLRKAGVQVDFPQAQTCCGQPAYNAGFHRQAARLARRTIKVFESAPGDVVIPSGSCAEMVRHGYLELFADDPHWLPRAQALADRTFELSEFLVDRLGVVDLGAQHGGRLVYHPSCHLVRGLGVERQPLVLLQAIHRAEVECLETECCGFGGVFAVLYPEISGEMLERKLESVRRQDGTAVVGCDVSCLMQIEGGLRRSGSPVRCAHLAQLLAGRGVGLR